MKVKILAIDDDALNLKVVKEILDDAGFQSLTADNAKAGLGVLADHPDVRAILLDWRMPDMDGIALLKQIRASKAFAKKYVIMLTAMDRKEHVAEALQAGANDYIIKPFDERTLIEKVRKALLTR